VPAVAAGNGRLNERDLPTVAENSIASWMKEPDISRDRDLLTFLLPPGICATSVVWSQVQVCALAAWKKKRGGGGGGAGGKWMRRRTKRSSFCLLQDVCLLHNSEAC